MHRARGAMLWRRAVHRDINPVQGYRSPFFRNDVLAPFRLNLRCATRIRFSQIAFVLLVEMMGQLSNHVTSSRIGQLHAIVHGEHTAR